MEHKYCGACGGERGCCDCKKAYGAVTYFGLTDFLPWTDREAEEEQSVVTESFDLRQMLLAADIGTTTLGVVCADARGKVIASYGTENPQRELAPDVVGRIDAACHGKAEELEHIIREALAKGFLFVLKKAKNVFGEAESEGTRVSIAIAGNTVMQHLFLGYPTEGLGKAPFVPYCLEGKRSTFFELFRKTEVFHQFADCVKQAEVYTFPGLSAFVGGDVVAGGYGLSFRGLDRNGREGSYLLMDLGTNGELLLTVNGKLYATSTAMGCAFEGGRFAYASEFFTLMAKALKEGASDNTGLLRESYFEEGFWGLFQEDIRTFQLAKGALRSGIELLCDKANIAKEQITEVYVAGGIGNFCDEEDLFTAGLVPREFIGKIKMVGNSCIGGLLRYLKEDAKDITCMGEAINLAQEPKFYELYLRFLDF